MLCKKVLPLLSEFFDGVLDADTAAQVSQHLDQCIVCRKEYKSLSAMHAKLSSLNRIPAPEYLQNLVQHRITEMQKDTWRSCIQNELELRWSRIRTTEGMWYTTRALGTIMASMFFVLISSIISPYYIEANSHTAVRSPLTPAYRQQLAEGVLMNLGMIPQRKPVAPIKQAINNQYLLDFAQSNSQPGKNDSLSVLAAVDQSGAPKIQNVIEYPDDHSLLNNFNAMIASARCRPASKNGETIPSHLVLMYSTISVSD
jgi:hypothetical protein